MTLRERIDAVESAYEFFLAYAAQGIKGDGTDGEIRRYLTTMRDALDGLADAFAGETTGGADEPFLDVLRRDASSSLAAVNLVMKQDAIGSQMVDNLNASIHVRALLTDVFLLDESMKEKG